MCLQTNRAKFVENIARGDLLFICYLFIYLYSDRTRGPFFQAMVWKKIHAQCDESETNS